MDDLMAYTVMGIMAVLTITILVLVADGWDGWR